MFDRVTHFSVWVTDQDQALEFYVGKLGLEVHTDLKLEFMRWLTVTVPGDRHQQIILAPLASPIIDPQNADRARDLLSKGYMGTIILSTPDCRATWTFRDIVGTSPRAFRTRAREEQQSAVHEKLLADGVEFTQEPLEQPYGIECVARDPFGNQIRIAQAAPSSAP
jgi:catechol 2,3-dioxygenase-like lactoylglutathione lyase family enzyme